MSYSDAFIQAEIDYRRERVTAEFSPKPRPKRSHHRPWARKAQPPGRARPGARWSADAAGTAPPASPDRPPT